ncbi:MAG: FHA domain-containing protein, partial [Anaerolineaceae bacterium]
PKQAALPGLAVALLILILLIPTPGLALNLPQPEPTLTITDLDIREFPLIRATLAPQHLQPSAGETLDLADLSVLEDDNELQARDIQENYIGVHLAVAINPNVDLDRRDTKGMSRYAKLVSAFKKISSTIIPGAGDHFSLFINPDVQYTQLTELDSLISALDGYQENLRTQEASLDSLTRALDALSMDSSPQNKILLYITPLPILQDAQQLESLAEQAAKQGITIHVWLAGDPDVLQYAQAPSLVALAEISGGSLFTFSGTEPIPDPGSYLQGRGLIYQVSYLSQIRKSGSHLLAFRLETAQQGSLTSSGTEFTVRVLPATPSFINPPKQVSIQLGEDGSYTPDALPLEITLDFPDDHPRSITSASLWVNGKMVQQNTQPPYNSFLLDLRAYDEPQALDVQAKVLDELGLEGSSNIQRIVLELLPPPSAAYQPWYRQGWFLGILGVALLGIIILVVVPAIRKPKGSPLQPSSKDETAPVLPPAPKSLATLIRLDKDNLPAPEKPIPIIQEITLIGRDPDLCQLVLDDPALEPMHAQLRYFPDGEFRLTDFNTTAGTWVNFAPVSTKGIRLQHGDILHLGAQTFRFSSGSRTLDAVKKPESVEPSDDETS